MEIQRLLIKHGFYERVEHEGFRSDPDPPCTVVRGFNVAIPAHCDSPIAYARMDINQRLTIVAHPSILLGWDAFNDFELDLDTESGRSCFNKV